MTQCSLAISQHQNSGTEAEVVTIIHILSETELVTLLAATSIFDAL